MSDSPSVASLVEEPPPARSTPPFRILYVDDDPLCSRSVMQWLGQVGFEATHAPEPAAADALLASREFDVLLSDVCMPGNCELEWVEAMSKRTDLPIVLITGAPELTTAMRAANLPIAGYLLKPFDPTELERLLRRVGAQRKRSAELRAIADEITQLADSATAPETQHPFGSKLALLAQSFAREAGQLERKPGSEPVDARLQRAIHETVEVLQKTKHHFRSRELGTLRARLQNLLATLARPGASAGHPARGAREPFDLN